MKKLSAYLGGPITGQSFDQATDWRNKYKLELEVKNGIRCYSPMRGKFYLNRETQIKDHYEDDKKLLSTLQTVVMRDRDDVKNSGVIIFNFKSSPDYASLGSAIEIGWGDIYRIPMISVIDSTDNIHFHGMIRQLTRVVDNDEEAIFLAKQILLPQE